MNRDPGQMADNATWTSLYRVAGWSALAVVGLTIIQIAVFFAWPPPSTVVDWYALFHENRLVGLLDMDLLLMVDYALLGVVYLALYVTLRRANQSWMAIAALLAFLSIAVFLASNTAFNMLTLSDQYAAATGEVERSELLAAGQATVAIWTGSAFNASYVMSAVAILIIAVVMLTSDVFGRLTGSVGIVMAATMSLPPTAGTVGLTLSLLSLIPTAIWLVLVARRLFELTREAD